MPDPAFYEPIFSLGSFYEELKTWQTGLGAFIGFFALAAAALYNFYLNRRRDRENRREEMLATATAIYGEIVQLREQLALLAKIVALFDQNQRDFAKLRADVYRPQFPSIFPAIANRLGLLPPAWVIGISKFYTNLEEASRSLDEILAEHDRPRFGSTLVLRPAVSGVTDVTLVLRQIEEISRIPKADEPDLGPAAEVIEMEDIQREAYEAMNRR
jgi:hypothetical protein